MERTADRKDEEQGAIDWSAVRAEFPALSGVTYLNTAGGAPISRAAAEAAMRYYAEARDHGDTCWPVWLDRVEAARASVADLIGGRPEQTVFLPHASAGLDLAERVFGRGIGLLSVADDFPSITIPWLNRGRPVRFLPRDAAGRPDFGAVRAADLDGIGTLGIGHVHFRTGNRIDLAEAAEFARAHDLALVVDATQSVGIFSLAEAARHADMLTFSVYKWPGAGYGVGVAHFRGPLDRAQPLPQAGWRSAEDPYALKSASFSPGADHRAIEGGHPNFAPVFALGAAVDLIRGLGREAVEARVLELAGELAVCLAEAGLMPEGMQPDSGIVSLPHADAAGLRERLREQGIIAGGFRDLLRFSVSFYNSSEDIDHLRRTLAELRN